MTSKKELTLELLGKLRTDVEQARAASVESVSVEWDIKEEEAMGGKRFHQGDRRVVTMTIEIWSEE